LAESIPGSFEEIVLKGKFWFWFWFWFCGYLEGISNNLAKTRSP
jgi:hypothetical protein